MALVPKVGCASPREVVNLEQRGHEKTRTKSISKRFCVVAENRGGMAQNCLDIFHHFIILLIFFLNEKMWKIVFKVTVVMSEWDLSGLQKNGTLVLGRGGYVVCVTNSHEKQRIWIWRWRPRWFNPWFQSLYWRRVLVTRTSTTRSWCSWRFWLFFFYSQTKTVLIDVFPRLLYSRSPLRVGVEQENSWYDLRAAAINA